MIVCLLTYPLSDLIHFANTNSKIELHFVTVKNMDLHTVPFLLLFILFYFICDSYTEKL